MEIVEKIGLLSPEDLEKVDTKEGKGRKYYIKDYGAVDSVTSVLDKGWPKAYSLIQWFIKNTEADILKKRKVSTEKGTKAHELFEELARADFNFANVSEECRHVLRPLAPWCLANKPHMINVEAPICYISNTVRTAGRIDVLCEINGERWVVDFKTGRDIYQSYFAQVGLYAEALGVKRAGILLLKDDGFMWKEVNIPNGFRAFKAAYFLANFKGEKK